MSDLSGRATNGGARTGGPVPVASSTPSSAIRPPTEIMRDRRAREQRRQEEQKAEELRRQQEERRRRETVERRAAAIQGTAAPRNSQASSQYTPDVSQQPFEARRSGTGQVAGSQALGDPTGRTSQEYSSTRARGPSSVPQQDQPRAAPPTASTTRRSQTAQTAQAAPRATTSSTAAPESSAQQGESAGAREGASSFPHAFHRWENLSAHWEGLTSFWLRKLEQNTEQIQNTVPNFQTLSRQITDLSAAGANLFHAVVELQRLRASSERKFQRWFFDTRGENEKNREIQGQLENQLKIERTSREESSRQRADALTAAENARREIAEVRRELMIAKDEARRAWDELGRRNQESLETAQSLKDGRITIVHGVQVVPYSGATIGSASVSQRPVTRDGQQYYGSTGGGYASPGDEAEYYYQQDVSPTNTDPFMESGPSGQTQYQDKPTTLSAGTYQPPYQVGTTPTTSSTVQTAIPPSQQRVPVTTQEAQRFYQHTPHETFLHTGSPQPASQAGPSATRPEYHSEASYVDTPSEEEGHAGTIDPAPRHRTTTRTETSSDDAYDTAADIRREQELSAQYGTGGAGGGLLPPEAPTVPATSSQAMATYSPGPEESGQPSYDGREYEVAAWEALQTRHHHPTRLSDVLEEEEERSSRRTGE